MESLEWTELLPIVFVVVGTLAMLMSQTDSAASGGWSAPSMQVIPVVVFVLTLALFFWAAFSMVTDHLPDGEWGAWWPWTLGS